MSRRRTRLGRRWSSVRPWLQGIALLGAMGSVATGFWMFDGQYERKTDALQHAREDAIRALWSQLGTTQLRAAFLEDRVYDLAARKAALGSKFPTADDVSLQRYKSQLTEQVARVGELRRQIDDVSKTR